VLMPAHQVDRETGNTQTTAGRRIYPSLGIVRFFSSALIEVSLFFQYLFERLPMNLHRSRSFAVIF